MNRDTCQSCSFRLLAALLLNWALATLLVPAHVQAGERHVMPISHTTANAQALVVTLHDAAGNAVVGASIRICTVDGVQLLQETRTDASGMARIAGLPETVRVMVAGTQPNGGQLYQRGMDAQGIRIWLDGAETLLALRTEADGAVVPDLSMITPDTPLEVAPPLPAAIAAPTSVPVVQSAPAYPVVELSPTMPPSRRTVQAPQAGGGFAWVGIVILFFAGVLLVVALGRGR